MGRRDLFRVETKVEVEYKNFDHFFREYTKNISKGGIFIRSERQFKPQDVLEIVLKLPDTDVPVKVLGEVVHIIEPEMAKAHGWDAGVGIHFIDFEEGAQQELEKYVAVKYKDVPAERAPDRRQHPRAVLKLRVKFPSMDVLRDDYSEDISKGGIFIQTAKPKKVGDQFILTLVHPETDEELKLRGEVVRVTRTDPDVPDSVTGMGIKFTDLDDEKRRRVEHFLGLAPSGGQ